MVMKGFAKAHNHKGGYEQWVYDEFKNVYEVIDDIEVVDVTELTTAVEALQTAVGDNTAGLVKQVVDLEAAIGDESTADSILGRIKALEDAS